MNYSSGEVAGIPTEILAKARSDLYDLYSRVVDSWPGFLVREGQFQMMHASLLTFLKAKSVGEGDRTGGNLAQIEAGTGTGKTVAYCLAAIVAAKILNKTVIVSTATVALQEQLFYKDLPRMASLIPGLQFEILKGRGRYVCQTRLNGVIKGDASEQQQSDLLGYADSEQGVVASQPADNEMHMNFFKSLAHALNAEQWSGDIDQLESPPDKNAWNVVKSTTSTCNGGACQFYKSCSFFKARRVAASATLQIANHSLILSTIQSERGVINPGESIFVFDEAHHLPVIAIEQSTHRMRIGSSMQLINNLRIVALRQAKYLPSTMRPDPAQFGKLITDCINIFSSLDENFDAIDVIPGQVAIKRYQNGVVSQDFCNHCDDLSSSIKTILKVVEPIQKELACKDESNSPDQEAEKSKSSIELSAYISQMNSMVEFFIAWASHPKVPWAKWVEFEDSARPKSRFTANDEGASHSTIDAMMCISPLTAAQFLAKSLWSTVGAAVCTSATLAACGRFDFFSRLSGLNRFGDATSLIVASPFDYQKQGQLRLPTRMSSPKLDKYSNELIQMLPEILQGHSAGQLMIFTTKKQMNACYQAMPRDLQDKILVQGEYARVELLRLHSKRIDNGQGSIIFALQSFGEGIDLPGSLCEHVIIDKIPFTPPNSPADEALAEWLANQGRNAFTEIAVPRASMRLAQWVGRGVRTENDFATITILDSRLLSMFYGRSILTGLPTFPVVQF